MCKTQNNKIIRLLINNSFAFIFLKVQNSIAFYDALQKNGVPAEIHLFEKGGHGFGMNNKTTDVKWMDWLKTWMEKNALLK